MVPGPWGGASVLCYFPPFSPQNGARATSRAPLPSSPGSPPGGHLEVQTQGSLAPRTMCLYPALVPLCRPYPWRGSQAGCQTHKGTAGVSGSSSASFSEKSQLSSWLKVPNCHFHMTELLRRKRSLWTEVIKKGFLEEVNSHWILLLSVLLTACQLLF